MSVDVNTAEPLLFRKTQQFLDCLPENFTDSKKQAKWTEFGKSFADLQQEFRKFKELTLKHVTSPRGFTHNDLLLENIVYNEGERKVSFIDYEYGGYNYLYFDVGNHFAEHAGVVEPDHSLYPCREYQREWLGIYLKAYRGERGDNSAFNDAEIENVCNEVEMFTLWSHLFWGIWSLVQAENSLIDFDYVAYAMSRLGVYFEFKDRYLEYLNNKM